MERGPAGLSIDRELCFALYSASRAMTACYRQRLDAIGLTYSQYLVMLILWGRGTVTLGVLCEELHLDSGTLSPLLKRLEHQGMITRWRREDDERILEVACTPADRPRRKLASTRRRRPWSGSSR